MLCMRAGCLQLLDTLPQSVYRVCDLLMVLTTRNGVTWQTEVLTSLISQVFLQFMFHTVVPAGTEPSMFLFLQEQLCSPTTALYSYSL